MTFIQAVTLVLVIQAGFGLHGPVGAQQQPQQRIGQPGAAPIQQPGLGNLPGGLPRQPQLGVAGAHPNLAAAGNPALQGRPGQIPGQGIPPIGAGQQGQYPLRAGETTPGSQIAEATGRMGANDDPTRQGLPGQGAGGLKPGMGQQGVGVMQNGNMSRVGAIDPATGRMTNGVPQREGGGVGQGEQSNGATVAYAAPMLAAMVAAAITMANYH